MKPFLKWAGGKSWLIKCRPELFVHQFTRYVEPFLGSGAVFFHLMPKKSVLSDLNPALINVYDCLRRDYKRVRFLLKAHARSHSDDYYYSLREKSFRSDFSKAAQFLYLNRTCWNGLYRENLRGEFNVPRGTKDTVIFDDDNFASVSELLANAKILASDFEEIIRDTRRGDFVFIDPPYTVKHNGNGFLKYNESIFSWADQVRLASVLREKASCGATYLVTNANHPTVVDLYRDFADVITITRSSALAADKNYRGLTQEALILAGTGWDQVIAKTICVGSRKAISFHGAVKFCF